MSEATDTVIIVHGLWMHGLVMLPLQRQLARQGFAMRRLSYPSWSGRLDGNVAALAAFAASAPGERLHVVAHSLGGLLALHWLAGGADARVARLVMLGSPTAGCHCATWLQRHGPLARLVGHSLPAALARVPTRLPGDIDVGIVAGTRPIGLGRLIPGLPKPNDGVVAVAETRWPDTHDRIELPVTHAGMLLSKDCADQTANFLHTGNFRHA